MKKLLMLVLVTSCAHHKTATDKEIDQYCQDLNVLYQKIAVISSNIANVDTTRTVKGGPYERQIATNCKNGICEIKSEGLSPMLKYQPKHPDADKNGYVAYPNINLAEEQADKIRWSHVYETVISNSPVPQHFFFKDKRAKVCFSKYPSLKESLDYSEYLGRKEL